MANARWDHDLLQRFEDGLDLKHPDRGEFPFRVLAQGRFSTVLEPLQAGTAPVVLKRLTLFRTSEEAGRYLELHRGYVRVLGERIGLRVLAATVERVSAGRLPVVYIVQSAAPEDAVGHMATYRLPPAEINRLLYAILEETTKVFDFNGAHQGELEVGFDARFSNWAIAGFDPERAALPQRIRLTYLDTSTPLMRRRGQEQFDAQLLVRRVPRVFAPLAWRYGVSELLIRAYDLRRTLIDVLADYLREGRAELAPQLADSTNWFFLAERGHEHFRPIRMPEVEAFARWDTFVWRAARTLRGWRREPG